VARAARDVGLRVGFAVAMKDRHPLVYGPSEPLLAALAPEARAEIAAKFVRPPPSPADLVALVEAVAQRAAGPGFDVQYGRTARNGAATRSSPRWRRLRRAPAAAIHMHLLETATSAPTSTKPIRAAWCRISMRSACCRRG